MNVTKYNIINPVTDKRLPYYDKTGYLIIPTPGKNYKYFLECSIYIKDEKRNQYFILLGEEKFDENCRKCETSLYGRTKLKPKGELKDYIEENCQDTKNISIVYKESEGGYDVYQIGE